MDLFDFKKKIANTANNRNINSYYQNMYEQFDTYSSRLFCVLQFKIKNMKSERIFLPLYQCEFYCHDENKAVSRD